MTSLGVLFLSLIKIAKSRLCPLGGPKPTLRESNIDAASAVAGYHDIAAFMRIQMYRGAGGEVGRFAAAQF